MTWDDVISHTQTGSAHKGSVNNFTSLYGLTKFLKNVWLRLNQKH